MPPKTQYVALDCEMVACGSERVAARVVLIDWKGRTVLDEYMKPKETVTDYLTFVSGITEEHLENADEFQVVQQRVKDMLSNKILVGHGVDNDLRALGIEHLWLYTRDTAYYQPFMRLIETSTRSNPNISQTPVWGPRKLKELALEKLQRDIQVPGKSHCPVEDAQAALDLYKSHRPRWEACMSNEEKRQRQQELQMAAAQYAYAYEQGLYQQESCDTLHRAPSFYGETATPRDVSHGPTLQTGYQPITTLGASNNHHRSTSYHNSLDTRSYHNPTPPRTYSNDMGLDTRSYHVVSHHVPRRSSFKSSLAFQPEPHGNDFASTQPNGHTLLQCQRSMDVIFYNNAESNKNNHHHNNAAVY
jgi:RNA exonuclease 4